MSNFVKWEELKAEWSAYHALPWYHKAKTAQFWRRGFYTVIKTPWHIWYWIRCHTYNCYHIVDCRTPSYRWGWSDVDSLMLNACFNLLKRFVEGEVGYPKDDKSFIEWDPEVLKEIYTLYEWWQTRSINGFDLLSYDTDNEMMLRLMKIRDRLWT